jgi:hypothetical protein
MIWNLLAFMLNPQNTKSWKRSQDIGFRKRGSGGSYPVAFLFAASIMIMATYSSIPNSLETDAASD